MKLLEEVKKDTKPSQDDIQNMILNKLNELQSSHKPTTVDEIKAAKSES